jgi:hypothetical protein
MDPNKVLQEIRQLVARADEHELTTDESDYLTELFENLDEWLSHGGFLPNDWNKERKSVT